MSGDRDQKPGDRLGIWRVDLGRHLPGNLAAIVELPRGTAKMLADDLALLIEQLSFWRFQRPYRLAVRVGPADIDLEAGCTRHQNKCFARWRLDGIGDRWFLHGGILAGTPSPHGSIRIPKELHKSTPGMARVAPPPSAVFSWGFGFFPISVIRVNQW